MNPVHPVPSGSPAEPGGAGAPEVATLLRRAARGDTEAFAQVYDATAGRVYGLALRVVRDPAQAEEVAQEAFCEIWRTASRFDPDKGSAIGWMLTLTHRAAVDRVRSAEASSRRDTRYHQQNPAEVPSAAHDTTAESAEASWEARRVRGALTELTEVQREAIELAYFGGYTHTEVASLLDLPVGTAKTRIRDGLIRLRDHLGVGGTGR